MASDEAIFFPSVSPQLFLDPQSFVLYIPAFRIARVVWSGVLDFFFRILALLVKSDYLFLLFFSM